MDELSNILTHLGEERENYYNAVSPALVQSSNFCFKSVGEMREKLKHELETPFYTRGYNPTVAMLRKKLAALEGAEDALVFSSGSAAVANAIMSVAKAGDHIVCVAKPYSWTYSLLTNYLSKYNVETTFVDGREAKNFEAATKSNTVLYYLESPNSLTFEVQDISAITKIAKQKNICTIIDNSYSSPIIQKPIEMGVDMVLHSATKYISGHSDVVAGVVCGSAERIKNMMAKEYMTLGATISPQDAWLLMRGLRTIELRVERSASSAQKIAEYLESHPKIKKVNYPFLKSNSQYELAAKQMKSGGGLLSIEINADRVEEVEKFVDALKQFLIATSWGGYESLVFPLCALAQSKSFENPLPWNLVRLYIGIENTDLLLNDLKQALEK